MNPRLNLNQSIVNPNGTMAQHFADFLRELERQIPIRGTGSPEGVVEAPEDAIYLDESGGAGSIVYRKMQTDIAGDQSKGWVAA